MKSIREIDEAWGKMTTQDRLAIALARLERLIAMRAPKCILDSQRAYCAKLSKACK